MNIIFGFGCMPNIIVNSLSWRVPWKKFAIACCLQNVGKNANSQTFCYYRESDISCKFDSRFFTQYR